MSRLRDRTAALSWRPWRPSATLAEHLPPVDDRLGDDGLSFDDVLAGRTHSPDLGRRLSFLVIRWVGCCVGGVLALLVAVRAQLAILDVQTVSGDLTADWLAVAGGLAAGGLVLFASLRLVLRFGSVRGAGSLLVGLPLVMVLMGSLATTHFPPSNFKSDEVRAEWTHLHPTLRHALWVARLGDPTLVLTDLRRGPHDYRLMGLRLPFTSRHYPQSDGYAHAVDLRVHDAGDLQNWARQGLFLLMGLRAERHVGTADHLHISLPVKDPSAI